jgi:chorismate synthase
MNTFGNIFKITIFGESHSTHMGIVLDGMIPGVVIDYELIKNECERRKPKTNFETGRVESDSFEIISGIQKIDNIVYSTGAPLTILVTNKEMRNSDYLQFKNHFRPGTSDFTSNIKYKGFNDIRGSGMFSGRLTVLLCIAGSIAKQVLPNINYSSEIISLGNEYDNNKFASLLDNINRDTVGGRIRLTIKNVPVGLGSPLFHKLTSDISSIIFSIGGVKGVIFGDALDDSLLYGSLFNDLIIDEFGHTKTNHSGGVNAGISNNNDLVVNVIVKPISSIGLEQNTFDFESKKIEPLLISGRHDKTILFRILPVLESAISIVLLDHYLLNNSYKNED